MRSLGTTKFDGAVAAQLKFNAAIGLFKKFSMISLAHGLSNAWPWAPRGKVTKVARLRPAAIWVAKAGGVIGSKSPESSNVGTSLFTASRTSRARSSIFQSLHIAIRSCASFSSDFTRRGLNPDIRIELGCESTLSVQVR